MCLRSRAGGAAVSLLLALAFGWASAPAGAATGSDCGRAGVVCSHVTVPLDPSGQVPGTVSLHVEELKARGTQRGVMFLIAGGPGQASTQLFDLPAYEQIWQKVFPGYTLVSFDPRGSGRSDALSCPYDEAACLRKLNPTGAFYSTADNASDIDAVRQALGFQKVSLWGTSYGTRLAAAYAQAYPTHVRRLLLDSVAPPPGVDPFDGEAARAIPKRLDAYCAAGACRGITANYGGEVIALANALAARPLQGWVREANGTEREVRLTSSDFLYAIVQTDLDPGLAAEMPAAVHAAREGDGRPLLRLVDLMGSAGAEGDTVNNPLFVATDCDDGVYPWQAETPLAQRTALVEHTITALPKSFFGGFGSWAAAALGNETMCVAWPGPGTNPAAANSAPYPDIPVLAISGDLDMRTPTGEARALLTHFPHGQLLTVTNAGHAALTSTLSPCIVTAVRSWLSGGAVPQSCSTARLLAPLAAFPSISRDTLTAQRVVNVPLIRNTLHEAEITWLLTMTEDGVRPATVAGLVGGKLSTERREFTLTRYSLGAGLAVSGQVFITTSSKGSLQFSGALHLSGRGTTSHDRLYLYRNKLVGLVGDKLIRG